MCSIEMHFVAFFESNKTKVIIIGSGDGTVIFTTRGSPSVINRLHIPNNEQFNEAQKKVIYSMISAIKTKTH